MTPTLNFPDEVPCLLGERVFLRELREDDIPAWFARASDPESAALAGDPIPASMEVGARWLARNREQFLQRRGIRWAIVPTGTTESIGTVGVTISSASERRAELGFVVGRGHWGRGFGTAASTLALHYGFHALGLAEVCAEVLQRNAASRRVLEKLGFQWVRDVVGDDLEACCLYSLRGPAG